MQRILTRFFIRKAEYGRGSGALKTECGGSISTCTSVGSSAGRKLKTADVIDKNIPTPIKIDLLTFNINEEEIEEGG